MTSTYNFTAKKYELNIYNLDKELVAKANLTSCFCEAKHYVNGDFYGYNLLIYVDGNFYLLETYDSQKVMRFNRKEIEKFIKIRAKAIYLMETVI